MKIKIEHIAGHDDDPLEKRTIVVKEGDVIECETPFCQVIDIEDLEGDSGIKKLEIVVSPLISFGRGRSIITPSFTVTTEKGEESKQIKILLEKNDSLKVDFWDSKGWIEGVVVSFPKRNSQK